MNQWILQHKNQLKIWLPVGLFILLGLIFLVMVLTRKDSQPVQSSSKTSEQQQDEDTQEEIKYYSELSGQEVSKAQYDAPVLGMIIENSLEARPQSGLDAADVVFEVQIEIGVTRFVALYQGTMPDVVGPVRSLRPYMLDLAMPFQASLGHVGGSPQSLSEAKSLGLRSLDEFANQYSYYRSTDRYAPHNVYTGNEQIAGLASSQGFNASEYTPWYRKAPQPQASPEITSFTVNSSSFNYNPTFKYNSAENNYLRSQGNQDHIDRESNQQLSPEVVVILKATHAVIDSDAHISIGLTGGGDAEVFQDGGREVVQWSKDSRTSGFEFTQNGQPFELNSGQTWVSIVPVNTSITY